MGTPFLVRVEGVDVVTPEYRALNSGFPSERAFLIAHLARVCLVGLAESMQDEIAGENGLCVFESGPAAVIYRPAPSLSPLAGADVLALAFGNTRVHPFPAILARAKSRDP